MALGDDDDDRLYLGWPAECPQSWKECEWRVLRGLATMRQPGIVRDVSLKAKNAWPEYMHTEEDRAWQRELKQEVGIEDNFRPTRRDTSDWDTAIGWFCAVNPPESRPPLSEPWGLNKEQKATRFRSLDLQDGGPPTWEWIGLMMKQTPYVVRRWHEATIDAAYRAALRQFGFSVKGSHNAKRIY